MFAEKVACETVSLYVIYCHAVFTASCIPTSGISIMESVVLTRDPQHSIHFAFWSQCCDGGDSVYQTNRINEYMLKALH